MIFQSDIVKEATSARIVEHIESEIIYGRLRKGDKLPTERKMAEDMSVSRATVREAVKALETMGILVSVQGSGNYITQTPETTVDRTLCALFALNDGTMENLLELRGILESQAFRDIAAYATDEEIESIAEKADYNYLDPSLERQNSNDHGFHLAMIQLSRNTLVKYLYTTLSALTKVYRGRVLAATLSLDEGYITQRDHKRIVNCLKNRDADGAVKALKEHLAITPKYMEIMPDAPENAVKRM